MRVQPVTSNVWNMLQKVSSMNILQHCSSNFVAEPFPWLHVQRSDFKVPATSKRNVALSARVKMSHVWQWL